MTTATTINFVQGDDLPTITAYLRDKNTAKVGAVLDPDNPDTWAPINLAGCTIRVQVREKGGFIVDTFNAAIIDLALSRVLLSVPPDAKFPQTAGSYEAEITIQFPGGSQQTIYDLLPIKVRERLQLGE